MTELTGYPNTIEDQINNCTYNLNYEVAKLDINGYCEYNEYNEVNITETFKFTIALAYNNQTSYLSVKSSGENLYKVQSSYGITESVNTYSLEEVLYYIPDTIYSFRDLIQSKYVEKFQGIEKSGNYTGSSTYEYTETLVYSQAPYYKFAISGFASESLADAGSGAKYSLAGNFKTIVPITNEDSLIKVNKNNIALSISNIKFDSNPILDPLTLTNKKVVLTYESNTNKILVNGYEIQELNTSYYEYDLLSDLKNLLNSYNTNSNTDNISSTDNTSDVNTINNPIKVDISIIEVNDYSLEVEVVLPQDLQCTDCTFVWDLDNNGFVDGKVSSSNALLYFGNTEPITGTATVYVLDADGNCIAYGTVDYNLPGNLIVEPPPTSYNVVVLTEDSTEPVPNCYSP